MDDASPAWPGWDTDDVTGWVLVQTYHRVSRDHAAAMADLGLTPHQLGVLAHLAGSPGASQAALARASLVTPQSMGELLSGMEAADLVRREAAARPGGSRAVSLTDRGRERLGQALPRIVAMNAPEAMGLEPAEERELNRLLRKVLAHLEH